VERLFDGIAVRPGKPTWFGLRQQTPVLGMPGNPVAAFVGANLLLACLLGNFEDIPYQSAITASASMPTANANRFHLLLQILATVRPWSKS
jgi:molybdopterin molybdotransferase